MYRKIAHTKIAQNKIAQNKIAQNKIAQKKTFWRPLISVWSHFSDEIVLSIFSHLLMPELLRISETCRRFRLLATDNQLWKVIYSDFWQCPRIYSFKGDINYSDLDIDISDTACHGFLAGTYHGMKVTTPIIYRQRIGKSELKRVGGTAIIIGMGNFNNPLNLSIYFILEGENHISYWSDIKEDNLYLTKIKPCEEQEYNPHKNIESFYTFHMKRVNDLSKILQRNKTKET